MKNDVTRRQVLAGLAGTGALIATGGFGCFRPQPTQPISLFSPAADEFLALVNARLVDVDKGEVLTDRTVVIKDGLIADVLADAEAARISARSFDCQGAYLIPGLINAHCHITSPSVTSAKTSEMGMLREQITKNYEGAICWGVTTVRDMGSMPKIMQKDRAAIERGDLLGPHILTPLSFLTLPNGYPDFMGELSFMARMMVGRPYLRAKDPAEAREFIRMLHDQGADFIKIAFDDRSFVYGRGKLDVLSDAQVEAIRDETSRLGMRLAAHHLYSEGLDRGLKYGIDTMEHVVGDVALTDEQLKKILDQKKPFVPTAMVGIAMSFRSEGDPNNDDPMLAEALKWRDEVQLMEMPKHCTVDVCERNMDIYKYYETEQYALEKYKDTLSFDPKAATRGLLGALPNLKRMIQEGVVLGVGNDSGVPLLYPGMVHLEMEALNRLGMPPAQALRAATLVNAGICGIEDRCGSIDKGKRADLVLLGADPLVDVRNTAKVKAVFKEGMLVSRSEDFAAPA